MWKDHEDRRKTMPLLVGAAQFKVLNQISTDLKAGYPVLAARLLTLLAECPSLQEAARARIAISDTARRPTPNDQTYQDGYPVRLAVRAYNRTWKTVQALEDGSSNAGRYNPNTGLLHTSNPATWLRAVIELLAERGEPWLDKIVGRVGALRAVSASESPNEAGVVGNRLYKGAITEYKNGTCGFAMQIPLSEIDYLRVGLRRLGEHVSSAVHAGLWLMRRASEDVPFHAVVERRAVEFKGGALRPATRGMETDPFPIQTRDRALVVAFTEAAQAAGVSRTLYFRAALWALHNENQEAEIQKRDYDRARARVNQAMADQGVKHTLKLRPGHGLTPEDLEAADVAIDVWPEDLAVPLAIMERMRRKESIAAGRDPDDPFGILKRSAIAPSVPTGEPEPEIEPTPASTLVPVNEPEPTPVLPPSKPSKRTRQAATVAAPTPAAVTAAPAPAAVTAVVEPAASSDEGWIEPSPELKAAVAAAESEFKATGCVDENGFYAAEGTTRHLAARYEAADPTAPPVNRTPDSGPEVPATPGEEDDPDEVCDEHGWVVDPEDPD